MRRHMYCAEFRAIPRSQGEGNLHYMLQYLYRNDPDFHGCACTGTLRLCHAFRHASVGFVVALHLVLDVIVTIVIAPNFGR